MNSTDSGDVSGAWQELAPYLDDAMTELGDRDRIAILLRFFERKPLRQIAETLGVGEDAARMRVHRALEKLRGSMARRGAACSAALLGAVLTERAVHAAPAAISCSIEVAALAAAKAAVAPSVLTTILIFMAKAKLKTLAVAGAGLVVAFFSAQYIYNQSREFFRGVTPAQVRDKATGQIQVPLGRGSKTTPAMPATSDSRPPSTLDNLRRILFAAQGDNRWPSTNLVAALHAFGPKDAHLAVPLLTGALASHNTNAQHRAASALLHLAFSAKFGKWPKALDGPFWGESAENAEFEQVEVAPLQAALLEALPALREKLREAGDSNVRLAALRTATTVYSGPDLLPDIIEALRVSEGHRSTIARYGKQAFAQHPEVARGLVEPLLSSADQELRVAAAICYAQMPGDKGQVALEILTQGLGKYYGDFQILDAIKGFGEEAKPYLSAMLERSKALFQLPQDEAHVWELKDKFCETLVTIDPNLKNTPELAQWSQEKEQLAALKARVADPAVTIPELTAALHYRETRYDALKRLGELGPAAAEALPALRQALKDAGKYVETLDTVGDIIKRIDPAASDPRH